MGSGTFAKYLTAFDVWALSLGCIIGWGAFVMPGTTFLPVAGPGGTVLAFLASASIMLVIAFNYQYLMAHRPGIGGVYAYTKEVFGKDHAFLSAWFLCLSYLSLIPQNATALAVMCRALFPEILASGWHYTVAGAQVYVGEILISLAALVLIGILAIFCKRFLQIVQTLCAALLFVGVLAIFLAALPHIRLNLSASPFGMRDTNPAAAVMTIIILAPWAFVGFEVVSLETAHFHFPVRKSGKMVGTAILIGSFIYCAMVLTAISAVPEGYAGWQAYIGDLGSLRGYETIPTFFASRQLLGPAGLWLIAGTAICAVVSSVIGFYRASARILANMARDRILSRHFCRPTFCFLFLMAVSAAISLFGRTALSWFVDLSSVGAIIGFGYVSAAVMPIAKKAGDGRACAMGAAGFIFSLVFLCAQMVPHVSSIETMAPPSYLLLSLWCLLGFMFYWRTMHREEGQGQGVATVGALFFLLLFSAVIWYAKSMYTAPRAAYSVILLLLSSVAILVMLLILARLGRRQALLERDRIRAIESSQAKTAFLFQMSHDIRTPMNAILGFAHLALREGLSRREQVDFLKKIEASGNQLLEILNDILDMSQIEGGQIDLHPKETDLAQTLLEIRDMFSAQMQDKGIDFSIDISDTAGRRVLCDRSRLSRAILNLVSNAYKFTPRGGSVSLSLSQADAGTGLVENVIAVRDTGIGMRDDFVDRMFTPFERERTSTVSGEQGTGLGLPITKAILEAMGGRIDVATRVGKGTTFTLHVTLPLAGPSHAGDGATQKSKPHAGAGDAQAKGAHAAPGDARRTDAGGGTDAQGQPPQKEAQASRDPAPAEFAGRRALLVEDMPVNMEIASMILQEAGFSIDQAANGREALEKVQSGAPGAYDLILMDIQMPVMDGYAAARAIRALPDPGKANIPILAMTANTFEKDRQDAADAGMQGHIAKPLDIEKMMATIRQVL